MAILNHSSLLTTASLSTEFPKLRTRSVNRNCCLPFGKNGSSNFPSFPSLRKSVIVSAKKNNKKQPVKKEDTHSFVVRPDEAGPYPEAVLLKEKKVQEDGRLLPEFIDDEEREIFEQLTLELESDLDVERMRHYEVVYMIHEDHVKEVESVNSKVQEFIKEKKGRLWRFNDWGLRRLAYPIKKARNAHYILVNLEFEAKWINDFKTMLDQDERVIRHLVIKKDKAETADCPPPPEFHTIRAGVDDENDDDVDDDIDDEYDDDDDEYDEDDEEYDDGEDEDIDDGYDDEEWDDDDEGEEDDVGDVNGTEGVIYVDDYIEDYKESRSSSKPSNVSSSKGRVNLRPKQVGR